MKNEDVHNPQANTIQYNMIRKVGCENQYQSYTYAIFNVHTPAQERCDGGNLTTIA